MPWIRADPLSLFWTHVQKTDGGCWLWTGPLSTNGYGVFHTWADSSKKRVKLGAHRYSYEALVGSIPSGMWVLHRCDVRPCCNPTHLYVGTVKDNARDVVVRNRLKGERHGFSKINDQIVGEMRAAKLRGEPYSVIAARYGVHRITAASAISGKSWSHLPGAIPQVAKDVWLSQFPGHTKTGP